MKIKESQIILILGRRGEGKTFFLVELLKSSNRLIYIDPIGEQINSQLGVIISGIKKLISYLEKNDKFRVIYQIGSKKDEFSYIARICVAKKNLDLAVDEIDMFVPTYCNCEHILNLIKRGRHYGVSIYGTSRRPPEVSRLLSSQAHRMVCFGMNEPSDINYLRQFIGADNAEKVKRLRRYEYIDWRG